MIINYDPTAVEPMHDPVPLELINGYLDSMYDNIFIFYTVKSIIMITHVLWCQSVCTKQNKLNVYLLTLSLYIAKQGIL